MSMRRSLEKQAKRAYALKNYPRTIQLLTELLREVGENPHTLHVLAKCSEYTGENERARHFAERALAVDPDHYGALQVMTQVCYKQDDQEAARDFARLALARIPRLPPPAAGVQWLARWFGAEPRSDDTERISAEDRTWAAWAEEHVLQSPDDDVMKA